MPFSVRSMARPTTAPDEIVSRPSSSQSSLNFISASMSSMPQLAPQRAMVSYSGPSPRTSSPANVVTWKLRQYVFFWGCLLGGEGLAQLEYCSELKVAEDANTNT